MPTQLGDKEFTATVYIISQEKPPRILLVHHKKYDKWMPPGGHIEAGENPYQAVIREALEETGIDITNYLPKPKKALEATFLPAPRWIIEGQIEPYGDQPMHYHIDLGYVVTLPHQVVKHQKDEAHNIGWFTQQEIEKLAMFDDVKQKFEQLFLEHTNH
jgi:8-oxo-dGTP pyrophosphatase MutT (NUDIX family)